MLGLFKHGRACPRFSKITKQKYLFEGFELFCLFVACSYTSMAATVLSCFSRVWSCMPKVFKATNHQYLWKGSCDFVDFLQVVISIEATKICYFGLTYSGITSQPIRLSDVVNVNNSRYQVDFLLPLKLEERLCCFGLWPQNSLGQSVCRIFYFWLVWLVKLNTGVHCCIVLRPSTSKTKFHQFFL